MSVPREARTLRGARVVLEPLGQEHADGLSRAVRDGDVHTLWYANVSPPQETAQGIDRRLEEQRSGRTLPYAIRSACDGEILGMTCFLNIDRSVPRVEIGATWLRASARGTGVNAEAKLLMLREALSGWECAVVEFRTHSMNVLSRAAIERLGARFDGVLRADSRIRDGSLRDTCVYSIITAEWPAVEAALETRVAHHQQGT